MSRKSIVFTVKSASAAREGRKTQTRRVIVPQPPGGYESPTEESAGLWFWHKSYGDIEHWPDDGLACAYGSPGDVLSIREAWAVDRQYDGLPPSLIPPEAAIWYPADDEKPEWAGRTRSGRGMPLWAVRMAVRIINVRPDHLQSISQDDALAEGVHGGTTAYAGVWDRINACRGYTFESNPWVWVIDFILNSRHDR